MINVLDYQQGRRYLMIHGDSAEVMPGIPENSVGLSVSSWPFLDQYTYSSSVRDAGNNDTPEGFFHQLGYILRGLYQVTMPGRWAIVHAKDHIIYGSENNGIMEIYPFSDECVRHMQAAGFRYQGRIFIDTDVVRENKQTNRLTQAELRKDASKHGVGMPEYALLFRKPPTDTSNLYADIPITSCADEDAYSLARWQLDAHSHWRSSGERLPYERDGYNYDAHVAYLEELDNQGRLSRANGQPIPTDNPWCWWDIQRTDVLNSQLSRGSEDERHICPLQLDFIERAIQRWSNPDDVVLDYFAGVGSVPYRALQMGRYGVGIELKQEYYNAACQFLGDIEYWQQQPTLFDLEMVA